MNDLDHQRELSARDDEIAVLRAENAALRERIGQLLETIAAVPERDDFANIAGAR